MPNEILELQKQAAVGARVVRQDRRLKGRARVSQEMRIRTADFDDGNFEEIRSTMNVSRDGFYFVTSHDRYYVGMRLRVRAAAESMAESQWENIGEVVRVHPRGEAFGVAVAFSRQPAGAGQNLPALRSSDSAQRHERRAAKRQSFIASTEVIDLHTGERTRVRTADLSTKGCYIDTLNPFPTDSTVLLQIEKDDAILELRARVISSHVASGMGLVFEGSTREQREVLASWLRGESPKVAPQLSGTARRDEEQSEDRFGGDNRFAKLVEILVNKGILSDSDVTSLMNGL